MFKTNSIIITSNTSKKDILCSNNNKLSYYKIYTLAEFNKLYYFDYNEKTIYYIMNKYNVKYEIAKIYINNLYNIDNDTYTNSKLKFLSELKQELINNKLLKINKLFNNFLNNKDIVIYNLPISKELNNLITSLSKNNNVEIINDKTNTYTHQIYEIDTIENEVLFVANKITELLKNNISISNIYLTNLNDEYKKLIRKIFPMYNIPYTFKNDSSIFGTFISNKFFENYNEDLSVTLDTLKDYINNEESQDIYNKIINIINKYTFESNKLNVKEMIISDFKNTKLRTTDITNSVHETSLTEKNFSLNDYVFLLSFNQGIIPTIYKDEDYLTDNDKKELNISYTVDKNNLEKQNTINILSNIKNLIITYKKNANGEDFSISNINEELNYEVINSNEYNYSYSNLYNKIKLTSLLDEYNKYGTKSDLLYTLNNHYNNLPYNTYIHKFTGINKQDLHTYLNNKITLSYSSLDKYFRCPFSFYIGNILKLNIYEETFYQLVGTLFHAILERMPEDNLYDQTWNEELSKLDHDFTEKENFFLNKLKEELKFIIEVIKDQENFTNLHDELHEERVYTNIEGNIKITFTGIIDKIKYKQEDDTTIVAIIDYKTGNPNLDLSTIKYGIGMQLPVYLYLAKNSNKLTNVKVAGFYLQKVLNNEVTVDKTHTYQQLKKKNLLLQGYSNENISILSEFDNSYMDSNIIKSMKVKNDNSFYSYAKVLSDKSMDIIENIAHEKIKEGADLITNANFDIAPKKIGKINHGCNLCQFKDICYHTADDVVELEELKLEDILGIGGEE
jgi:ATP-dependent helicase/DNAse subunit B